MLSPLSGPLHAPGWLTTGNSTSTPLGSGAPLYLVAVEVAVALAVIGVLGIVLTRLVRGIARRAGASKSVTRAVDEWFLVIMLVLAVITVTRLTGLSSDLSTLTVSGIAGLAVSLALQTTLSNVIAGVLLFRDGVVRLGDRIEFSSVKGEVIKLSLRTTWIRRDDGAITIIGNSNLSSGPIVNLTAKERLEKKLEP